MWHLCVTGRFADFSYSGIFYSEPTTPHLTMHIVSMRPPACISVWRVKNFCPQPFTCAVTALCTNAHCFFYLTSRPFIKCNMFYILGGNLKNTYSDHHTTILGEQLVWEQEDPVQEEHREGSGGSQHVRCEGCTGRRCQPWRISRSEYLFVLKNS